MSRRPKKPAIEAMTLLGARRAERRGTPADVLVLGLGNPGAEYHGSRHNLGVEVIEELARRAKSVAQEVEGAVSHRRDQRVGQARRARVPADVRQSHR